MVVVLMSVGALLATRNLRQLETHVVVVLMGLLAFCFLLSTANAAIFASISLSRDKNGQSLPTASKSLKDICEEDGQ